jgi:hypothetical protein
MSVADWLIVILLALIWLTLMAEAFLGRKRQP